MEQYFEVKLLPSIIEWLSGSSVGQGEYGDDLGMQSLGKALEEADVFSAKGSKIIKLDKLGLKTLKSYAGALGTGDDKSSSERNLSKRGRELEKAISDIEKAEVSK